MKRIFVTVGLVLLLASCNNNSDKTSTKEEGMSSEKINYAYMPMGHDPDYWEKGDQKNLAMVLQALKDFENGDVDAAMKAFGDSVQWNTDGFEAKLSKDSLHSMLSSFRKSLKNLKIDMDDYESVIGKDKKSEWVSLWYKQTVTDMNGKTDSLVAMDDCKIENGKVTVLDEKQRRFAAPKK